MNKRQKKKAIKKTIKKCIEIGEDALINLSDNDLDCEICSACNVAHDISELNESQLDGEKIYLCFECSEVSNEKIL